MFEYLLTNKFVPRIAGPVWDQHTYKCTKPPLCPLWPARLEAPRRQLAHPLSPHSSGRLRRRLCQAVDGLLLPAARRPGVQRQHYRRALADALRHDSLDLSYTRALPGRFTTPSIGTHTHTYIAIALQHVLTHTKHHTPHTCMHACTKETNQISISRLGGERAPSHLRACRRTQGRGGLPSPGDCYGCTCIWLFVLPRTTPGHTRPRPNPRHTPLRAPLPTPPSNKKHTK
jgi:hypothetical protein